jgi:hypothetical protein
MAMQYDVRSARLTQSGWIVSNPTRVKGISIRGGGGSNTGRVILFDTSTAPVAATYGQSGNTVTVTSTAHGLANGSEVAIAYYPNANLSSTNGNYTINVANANAFTILDPNLTNVTSGTTCYYVPNGNYMIALAIPSGDVYIDYWKIPGEGIRATQKVYANMDANLIYSTTIFYG